MNHNFALGRYGEEAAEKFYLEKGFTLLGKNVRIKRVGEIDLIFIRKTNTYVFEVVFVEVKTRSSMNNGYGYEAINNRKITTMKKCAYEWLRENRNSINGYCKLRLDVVSIDFEDGIPKIKVFENIS
ncbi:MAG: YraN family protein [Acidimicrobiia bacterium]